MSMVRRKMQSAIGRASINMFLPKDNTYNEIREKSLNQWLEEMEQHEDVAVRCGVPLCREYMKHLAQENEKLKQENALKNEYLKKVKAKMAEKQ